MLVIAKPTFAEEGEEGRRHTGLVGGLRRVVLLCLCSLRAGSGPGGPRYANDGATVPSMWIWPESGGDGGF
jgi:hypothetical protein